MKLEDCYQERKLRKAAPSQEKAHESIRLARLFLDEAELTVQSGACRTGLMATYMGWFHAARALLYQDGIFEKSHFCLGLYLKKCADDGQLESRWPLLFGRLRTRRHDERSSFGPSPGPEEVEVLIEEGRQFTNTIASLIR